MSIGLFLVIPLFYLIKKHSGKKSDKTLKVMLASILLMMVMMIDLWLPGKWIFLINHIHSNIQTMATILIIYSIVTYFI